MARVKVKVGSGIKLVKKKRVGEKELSGERRIDECSGFFHAGSLPAHSPSHQISLF